MLFSYATNVPVLLFLPDDPVMNLTQTRTITSRIPIFVIMLRPPSLSIKAFAVASMIFPLGCDSASWSSFWFEVDPLTFDSFSVDFGLAAVAATGMDAASSSSPVEKPQGQKRFVKVMYCARGRQTYRQAERQSKLASDTFVGNLQLP